jgi:Peptidase family M28
MKKIILLYILLSTITSCKTQKNTISSIDSPNTKIVQPPILIPSAEAIKFMNTITLDELKNHLTIVASDEMGGRETGSKGQKKAGNYLIDFYKKNGVPFPKNALSYYQKVPASFMNKDFGSKLPDSENIWAFIEGTEKPEEILVISAHYDHIGILNGSVYNGADDDGSGTVALLEIAQAFAQAKKAGFGPKRSILFLHVTGEEHGLHGSRYYTDYPIFPLDNTITDINIDMIGRRDEFHKDSNKYIYVIGSDYLSTDLYNICESVNKTYLNLNLDYKFNDRQDPNRFYYRSDHYNFAKHNIPSVFLFNGVHEDYHQASDEVSKIEFDALTKRAQLAFVMAWELANRKNRPIVDKDGK